MVESTDLLKAVAESKSASADEFVLPSTRVLRLKNRVDDLEETLGDPEARKAIKERREEEAELAASVEELEAELATLADRLGKLSDADP